MRMVTSTLLLAALLCAPASAQEAVVGQVIGFQDTLSLRVGDEIVHLGPGSPGYAIPAGIQAAVLAGKAYKPAPKANVVSYKTMKLGFYKEAPRNEVTVLKPEERTKNFNGYVLGFDKNALLFEASRCMSCGSCFDCDTCWSYCGDGAVKKMPKGQHYNFILDKCIGCSKCADECPCSMIDMV